MVMQKEMNEISILANICEALNIISTGLGRLTNEIDAINEAINNILEEKVQS